MNPRAALAVALAGLVGLLWSRRSSASSFGYVMSINSKDFETNPNYLRWKPTIAAAQAAHGLPTGLLARLLYQESRYRSDVISGATASPAGAQGIAQFMPATAAALGINPLDPAAAIDAAARYLRKMFGQFRSWPLALAAYNWGPGNVRAWQAGKKSPPSETLIYVASISGSTLAA